MKANRSQPHYIYSILFILFLLILIVPAQAATPVANFTANVTSGAAPLYVSFTDTSTGSPTGWAWFFGDETYTAPWTQVNASSGWTARYGQSSVVMPDGSIVLMGGFNGATRYNDVWRSTNNGTTWTQVNASAGWTARYGHRCVIIPDGSIVLMGGNDGSPQANDTWRSTDNGATWTRMNASSGWTARSGHTSVAMPDGIIVLMGGYVTTQVNDTWRSTDKGATWTRMNASSGWTARSDHSSVVLPDGSIVLMGGSGNNNNVWRSTDYGAHWTQMTASAEWPKRYAQMSVAMPDGSIVLMGGYDSSAFKDVWRSTDYGAHWTQVNASAGWSARSHFSSVVMPDGSIVLMGGFPSPYFNDVWRFNPIGSSLKSPSHTYTTAGNYAVALQAYNAGGYNSTQKTGYITVTGSPVPVADFTAAPLSGAKPLTVVFSDLSVTSPITWNWSFGDGNNTNATAQNPVHTYNTPGIYSVSLNVTNANGYNATTKMNYVWVDFANVAMFRGDRQHTGVYSTGGIAPTNNLKWSFTTGDVVYSSPAVANGIVYILGYDRKLYALNASTGVKIWNFTTAIGTGEDSSPAVADGIVYIGSWDKTVYALNATTGEKLWGYITGGSIDSSPAVADGVVYIGNTGDHKVYALNATSGAYIWDYHFAAGIIQSSPAVADGIVYIGSNDNKVYALNASTGVKIWDYFTGNEVFSSPAVVNGIVYVGNDVYSGTNTTKVYALNASTGAKIWDYITLGGVQSSPAVADGIIYFGSLDYNITALNATTGAKIWDYKTGNGIISSPAVADGIIYIGSYDNKVYALNASTGVKIWDYTTGNFVYSSPAVANGIVYFGSKDGKIYALGGTGTPAPVANFTAIPLSGTAPLPVSFTDLSLNSPTGWAWFFGDENFTAPWTQQTASAGWTRRDGHSSVVLPDGSVVLMGGMDSGGTVYNDTWRSTDKGATWTNITGNPGWTGRYHHTSVAMPDGSIVLMGGEDSGGDKNDTWRSTDNGATWTQVNASSGWSARGYHSSVAMPDGSIVLMGGQGYGPVDKNDTWRSTNNGATWTQVNASAGWSARGYHSSVAMPDGSIVLMGGANSVGFWYNDVWRSTDNGATWTQVNASAGWYARWAHSSVALPDGSIVLMGGNQYFVTVFHDVWRSTDNGATWTQLPYAEWTARRLHSSVALPDGSIVLMGGEDSGGLKNDVWRFMPAGSSAQSPSHTYTTAGNYQVALQAYNNGGYNSTRKAGYITVTGSLAPAANFTANVTSGTYPLAVQFTDSSIDPGITSWKWNFTTGGTIVDSTSQNPVYTYVTPGNYTVNLTVTNSSGSDSEIKPAYITVNAQYIDVSVNGTISNWNFVTGTNVNTTGADLTIDTNINQWRVDAKDALDTNKTAGTEGKMTEWSGSSYVTVPPGKVLLNAVQVNYGIGSYITISGTDQLIKSGTSPGFTSGDLGVSQEIAQTDPGLSGSNQYRIVVTFTGSAA